MKLSLSLLSLVVLSFSTQAFAKGLALKSEQGSYQLEPETSDYYCSRIPMLELIVNGTQVQIIVSNDEKVVRNEIIPGVNTSHYTQYSGMTDVIYTRHVYKQGKLKRQRSAWGFGFIPGSYKDDRIVLEVLGEGRITYNYESFGTTLCNFIRVD
jgi:hypothetical protein